MKDTNSLKNISLFLGICFLVLSGFFIGFTVTSIVRQGEIVDTYFEEEEITQYDITIPTRDSSHISAIIYMPNYMVDWTNQSAPTIIFVPGANNHKSNLIELKIQAVKFGFVAIAMEQRGHGESGGYYSLYEKEQDDISDVIDYLQENFKSLNCSHIGLIGMSLGGGAALAAQTIDERIYASVLYHPAADLADIFCEVGIDLPQYIGFLPGIDYPYSIPFGFPDWDVIINDTWYSRNTMLLVNETNSKNMLILHGTEDDLVRPEVSQQIIDSADPSGTRDDVQLIMRDGLGHGSNERNKESFKFTMAWFEHFYIDGSINISDMETEATYITLDTINIPNESVYSQNLITGVILMVIGLFLFFNVSSNLERLGTFEQLKSRDLKANFKIYFDYSVHESEDNHNYEKKTLILRSAIIIISYLISGVYSRIRNPSVIYGIFFYPLVIAIPLLILIPKSKNGDYKIGGKNHINAIKEEFSSLFTKENTQSYLQAIITFSAPFFIFLFVKNYAGLRLIGDVAIPEFSIAFMNISMFSVVFALPVLFMRDIHQKKSFWLIPVYMIGAFIFTFFIPIAPIENPIVSFNTFSFGLVVSIIVGLVVFVMYWALLFLKRILTKNHAATLTIIGITAAIFLWMRFMRIF